MEFKGIIDTFQYFSSIIKDDYSDFLAFTIEKTRQNNSPFPAVIVKICLYSKEIEEANGYVKIDEEERAIIIYRERETETTDYNGWVFWSDLQRQNQDLPNHPSDCGESLLKEGAIKWLSMGD